MKRFKKVLVAVLILCLCIVPFSSMSAVAADDGIMPRYNNVSNATANMGISDSGKMTINYSYVGSSSITTKAVITIYIEKRTLGVFWSRVDIPPSDDQWVYTIYDYKYTNSTTYQLSSTGTYRVTVNFKIYGSGGAPDEIENSVTATY